MLSVAVTPMVRSVPSANDWLFCGDRIVTTGGASLLMLTVTWVVVVCPAPSVPVAVSTDVEPFAEDGHVYWNSRPPTELSACPSTASVALET